MPRDLFEEYGIAPKKREPIDVFEQENISLPQEKNDLLMSILRGAGNLGKGLARGTAQGIADTGVSTGNLLLGGTENILGLHNRPTEIAGMQPRPDIGWNVDLPRIPHPNLLNENPESSLEGAGQTIGELGSMLFAPGAAAYKGAKAAGNLLERIPGTSRAIAKILSRDKDVAINEAKAGYNDFFRAAEESGVEKIKPPKINVAQIVQHSSPNYHEALLKFQKDPTVENAHWAQSDLGFLVRHLKKLDEKVGLASPQQKTLKEAIAAQNRLKQSMFAEEHLGKNPRFESKYNELSKDYAEKVIPYKQLKELSEFDNGKLKAKNLVKSLLSNDEFMLGLGKKYPSLMLNQVLKSKATKVLGASALAGLGYEEGKKFGR